jgi:glycosyltransferase involved in cell wall biosynthesis
VSGCGLERGFQKGDIMSLSVLIPVYNEADSIETTIKDIRDVLMDSPFESEIVIVNDGSTDQTENILNQQKGIRVVSHKVNKGYGAALKTGIRHAKYDNICITDADGTYPNKVIPVMFKEYLKCQLDMIVGARTGENVSYSFIKKIPKYFIKKLANYISGTKIPDINSGLRIFKKEIAIKYFKLISDGFSFTTTITLSAICHGYDIDYYPIDYYKREGKSKISPVKDTIGFFTLLSKIAMFFNPLKFFMPFVLLLTAISCVFIYRDVFISRNLSQSSVLFPVLTIQLLFIGLLADMITRKI